MGAPSGVHCRFCPTLESGSSNCTGGSGPRPFVCSSAISSSSGTEFTHFDSPPTSGPGVENRRGNYGRRQVLPPSAVIQASPDEVAILPCCESENSTLVMSPV